MSSDDPQAHASWPLEEQASSKEGRPLTRGMRPYATIAFLGLRWKFKGPIKIGDTIRVHARVIDKKETSKLDRGVITLARQVLNQRGEVVQEGETDLMVARLQ